MQNDAQPCAQPDGPVRVFNLAGVGAARRLAKSLGGLDRGAQSTFLALTTLPLACSIPGVDANGVPRDAVGDEMPSVRNGEATEATWRRKGAEKREFGDLL